MDFRQTSGRNTYAKYLSKAWLLMFVPLSLDPALAAPAMPSGFEPGQIERQIESAPLAPVETVVPDVPDVAQLRDTLPEQTFVLSAVLVEGMTVYNNLDISRFYQNQLGRTLTVKDMRDVAEEITRYYRSNGYFLASAFLPAQTIEYGVVRIRVVEGYVGRVNIAGAASNDDPLIRGMLRPLLEQRPLRRIVLDNVFLSLAGLTDLNLHPEMRAVPDQLGEYELSLRAEKKQFDGSVSVDNRGSLMIGPTQGVVSLRAFDITGHHETYQLKLAVAAPTRELSYLEASTDWILGPSGLRVQASIAHTEAEPGGSLKSQQVRVVNDKRQLGIVYPLPHAENESRSVDAVLSSYHSRTNILGVKRLEDRLTSLSIGYRHGWQPSPSTVHSMSVAVGQGLKLDDSMVLDTQRGSGPGRVDFTKLASTYGFKHKFSEDLMITVLVDGQYAVTKLPTSERYSIGGAQFGRAYDPSEISGDHGLAARFELSGTPAASTTSWRFVPYGYYDLGAVWEKDAVVDASHFSLASLGAGVRAEYNEFASYLELAKPLTRSVASLGRDGRDVRLFAGAAFRF